MKFTLNPLPWIEKWLNQPSDFWLAMDNFNKQNEDQLLEQLKERTAQQDFDAAKAMADDLFGIKS